MVSGASAIQQRFRNLSTDAELLDSLGNEGEKPLGVLVRLHGRDPVHARPVFHCLRRLKEIKLNNFINKLFFVLHNLPRGKLKVGHRTSIVFPQTKLPIGTS